MADNLYINVNGNTEERLRKVLSLFDYKTICGYRDENNMKLILFYSSHSSYNPFMSSLPIEDCAPLIINWINNKAIFAPEPDHDGINVKGWVAFNEEWGHIKPYGYNACVAIKPCWMMFGK